ncbi:hypothetical protein OKW49_005939 [Paraburkholderia youngii]
MWLRSSSGHAASGSTRWRGESGVQATAVLIERRGRLLDHAEQLRGDRRGHPRRLLTHLRVFADQHVGEGLAAVDDAPLGWAHLRDARVRQCVAFERAVVRHDDDAVLVGDEGARVRDPVAQSRDADLGDHRADQQAVRVHRRGDEDARLAARATDAVGFSERAEQCARQIAARAHIHADERLLRALGVRHRVAGGDADAVRVDDPDLVEPGEALRFMQEPADRGHLRVLQQRGPQRGFRRLAVHGIILRSHEGTLDHVHFGHGCGDGAGHREVAGNHFSHVVDDRGGHLPLRVQRRVQLLLYHPVRDHASHEPADEDDQHEADRPGYLAQGCPVHRPSDPSGCDMQLACWWAARSQRCVVICVSCGFVPSRATRAAPSPCPE